MGSSWTRTRSLEADSQPLEFAGNAVPLKPLPGMAVVLTRTGLTLLREDKEVGSVALVDLLGEPNTLGDAYQYGDKVQPVVFTDDNLRIFVGGRGVIYEIDPLTVKLIDTITLPDGQDVTSLATVGNLLMIGESGSGGQLLAMNIAPGSSDFGNFVSVRSTDIVNARNGIGGMTIGPDGNTLVVSVPVQASSFSLARNSQRGTVLIFDLSTLDFKTGRIDSPVVAKLPDDGISGKVPYAITATQDGNRYLVTDLLDYNRGLSTLTLTRDDEGHVTAAVMHAIDLSQPANALQLDRLDIQRAQSAVLVTKDGVEYAIVADDNLNTIDPYYKAMYTPPDYEFLSPFGPPTAIGGSASARKVAVGGKLGIIKDPFGLLGTPQYLGATLPLAGYGIQNLSVSPDGTVLIGQLAGRYTSPFDMTQEPSQAHAWSVDALIAAALASHSNLSQHLSLPTDAEQLIADSTAAPIGTFFDEDPTTVYVTGNMGDVITVNLKELAAQEMMKRSPEMGWTLAQWEDHMSDFTLAPGELDRLKSVNDSSQFIPVLDSHGALLTRDGTPNGMLLDNGGDFAKNGLLFLAPNITAADEKALRAGDIVFPKLDHFEFSFKLTGVDGKISTKNPNNWQVSIGAKDYALAANTLMGDRPLDNPGYSAFTLAGSVGDEGVNDTLDVWRVEQRLRYLGFGPSTIQGQATNEIDVNGVLSHGEITDLRQFYEITHGNEEYSDGSGTAVGTKGRKTVTVNFPALPFTLLPDDAAWLNAYNAPHWMTYRMV